jgi:hypothetical protein
VPSQLDHVLHVAQRRPNLPRLRRIACGGYILSPTSEPTVETLLLLNRLLTGCQPIGMSYSLQSDEGENSVGPCSGATNPR